MEDRPGIYVKLEVGVSWPRHFNKRRSVSYTSGGLKEQAQRALPAPAPGPFAGDHPWPTETQRRSDQTYLRHVYDYASQSYHTPEQAYGSQLPAIATTHPDFRANVAHPNAVQDHQYVPYRPACDAAMLPPQADLVARRSRSPSSHNSRGSSAPPPTHDRPWDDEPQPMASNAMPGQRSIAVSRPHTWKPLPATPSQFRLGDELMPWTGSPDPAAYSAVEDSLRGQAETSPKFSAHSTRTPAKPSEDDRERGQTVEMQSLATALMTVDNGFEDQWWFQGSRTATVAGDLIPTAHLRDMLDHAPDARRYSTSPAGPQVQVGTPASTIVDIVSPLSGHSSPMSRVSHRYT